jgi:ABC-type multidrug transport system ATPase subunit
LLLDVVRAWQVGGTTRRLNQPPHLHCPARLTRADEPSTGLDPASRRLLWQVVRRAAQRHALVLTTHSLEEAEALCGRIGLVVAGRLRCVGTPQELTSRWASQGLIQMEPADRLRGG